jgi:hypothetical protein
VVTGRTREAAAAAEAPDVGLDELGRRRLEWLIRRAQARLAEAVAASKDGRAELHIVLVQHGNTLTKHSRIVPPPEHAPE